MRYSLPTVKIIATTQIIRVQSKTEVVCSHIVGASLGDWRFFLGIIHGDTPYKYGVAAIGEIGINAESPTSAASKT